MSYKLAVAVIHGMGSQKPNYSDDMVKELNKRLGNKAANVVWKEIYWADVLADQQEAYLRKANRTNHLDFFALRRFIVSALGDASAYRKITTPVNNITTYDKIHGRVREVIKSLDDQTDDEVPLIVFAHSLGCHIISNYIWDLQKTPSSTLSEFQNMERLAGLVMFGCNIPLFVFAHSNIKPIRFPGNALTPQQKQKARWYNFFDPDDVLGYPLKSINSAYCKVVDADYPINVGSVFSSWNPLSHNKYWTDNDFTKPAAKFLLRFLKPSKVSGL